MLEEIVDQLIVGEEWVDLDLVDMGFDRRKLKQVL